MVENVFSFSELKNFMGFRMTIIKIIRKNKALAAIGYRNSSKLENDEWRFYVSALELNSNLGLAKPG